MRLTFGMTLMKNLIKIVHTGKNKLGWDEETYRGVLLRETGKNSAKDCTTPELERVARLAQPLLPGRVGPAEG